MTSDRKFSGLATACIVLLNGGSSPVKVMGNFGLYALMDLMVTIPLIALGTMK